MFILWSRETLTQLYKATSAQRLTRFDYERNAPISNIFTLENILKRFSVSNDTSCRLKNSFEYFNVSLKFFFTCRLAFMFLSTEVYRMFDFMCVKLQSSKWSAAPSKPSCIFLWEHLLYNSFTIYYLGDWWEKLFQLKKMFIMLVCLDYVKWFLVECIGMDLALIKNRLVLENFVISRLHFMLLHCILASWLYLHHPYGTSSREIVRTVKNCAANGVRVKDI